MKVNFARSINQIFLIETNPGPLTHRPSSAPARGDLDLDLSRRRGDLDLDLSRRRRAGDLDFDLLSPRRRAGDLLRPRSRDTDRDLSRRRLGDRDLDLSFFRGECEGDLYINCTQQSAIHIT